MKNLDIQITYLQNADRNISLPVYETSAIIWNGFKGKPY